MVRKLVILMTAGFLIITPITANALGFGVVKLNSALNERFDAEVEVLSPTPEDIKSLKIKLASQSAFLRSGIERTALYSSLLFEVKQRSNDTYYIQISSKGTIREPFLNFLLEMSWKNGRMLREYTVLLDPPGQYSAQQQAPQPTVIETPETMAPAAIEKAEMEAPQVEPFVELAEGEQFPRVELTKYEGKDSGRVEQQATMKKVDEPKLEPLPEPKLEALPEPELEPLPELDPLPEVDSASSSKPTPLPEPEPELESAPMAVDMVEESKPFDEEQLFPSIPLRAYSEDSEYAEATEEPTEPAPAELMGGDLDYGLTAKNDNLWNIAERMRPSEDVSIYQVMMALVQANPDAFVEGNAHRLKVGHVLRIDDPALFSAMSQQQAANEFKSQTRDWDEFRNVASDSIQEQPVIATQVESETVVAEPAEKGELILATPESSELKSGTGVSEEAISNDLATLKAELSQMQEQANAEGGKNEALNSRIRQMEEKLADAQRILSVQDDELAVLQKQLSETQQEPVAETTTETEAPPVAEEVAVTEEAPSEEAPVVDAVTGPAATSEVAESESPVELAERIAQDEKAKPAPAAMEEGVMGMVMGWVGKAGDMASGIGAALGGVLGSMMMYIIIGVVVLFIILFFVISKRRKQGDDFEESILKGTSSGATSSSDVPSANSATSEESSFLSDFAVSGSGAIQTEDSEVDPLTEADVFIAYGRHEAAEERLQEAIQLEPERDELKLKLLELYSTTKNTSGFESTAEAIHASLDGLTDGNPTWDKVVALGKPLLPDNPLFNSGETVEADAFVAPAEENNVELSDSQVLDICLETGGFSSSDFNLDLGNSSTEEDKTDDSGELDFDLDLGDASVTEEATADEEVASMDFNLDESDSASDAGLDFNLDLDAGTVEETSEADSDTATMDLDGGLDFALDDTEASAIDLSVDEPESTESTDFEISSDGDEVGTKLDLAKAYIDMGDPEGARSILDEVLDEGNDQQKSEAEQLIQQIA